MSNLIEEARKLSNVKIVDLPVFNHYYIENDLNGAQLKSQQFSVRTVTDQYLNDTINYINKKGRKSLFFIYQIEENFARWYELETKAGIIQRERKEKLQKIEIEL